MFKRLTLSLFLASFAVMTLMAQPLHTETVNYDVMFKWGLINKKAGNVSISLSDAGDKYHSLLTGASASWADKIFKVRDTLSGRMTKKDMTPLYYEKISHEGGKHKHDIVTYNYSVPGIVKADCIRRAFDKDGKMTLDERRELEAKGSAIDMLTSFYYMRSLPYEKMVAGQKVSVDIFSGKRKEILTIHFNGLRSIKIGKNTFPSYYITFTFTSKGGEKTSDDMEAWISTEADRIPLRLEGKLPVGKVQCFYTGK